MPDFNLEPETVERVSINAFFANDTCAIERATLRYNPRFVGAQYRELQHAISAVTAMYPDCIRLIVRNG